MIILNRIVEMIEKLKKYYPDAKCSLNFSTPFELLVAVVLSAQCTDERVNKITPELFKKCNTPQGFVDIDIKELEDLIHSAGFYKNKSKNLKECAKKLVNEFDNIVPDNMEKLVTLPGVGRKSANVILLDAYGIAVGIAVDTHAKRVSNRLGLSKESDSEKIEKDLLKIIPKEYLKDINHLFVWHGRYTCTARNPKCSECPVKNYCTY